MIISKTTLRRAMDLGAQAYLDDDYANPFTTRRYTGARLFKMDDLAAAWQDGWDDAEREARAEMRWARSERAVYFSGLI